MSVTEAKQKALDGFTPTNRRVVTTRVEIDGFFPFVAQPEDEGKIENKRAKGQFFVNGDTLYTDITMLAPVPGFITKSMIDDGQSPSIVVTGEKDEAAYVVPSSNPRFDGLWVITSRIVKHKPPKKNIEDQLAEAFDIDPDEPDYDALLDDDDIDLSLIDFGSATVELTFTAYSKESPKTDRQKATAAKKTTTAKKTVAKKKTTVKKSEAAPKKVTITKASAAKAKILNNRKKRLVKATK